MNDENLQEIKHFDFRMVSFFYCVWEHYLKPTEPIDVIYDVSSRDD